MQLLKNKNGFSYILISVFVLMAVMLTFIALQYAAVFHIAREQKRNTQLLLDSTVTTYSVEQYNAIKQGSAFEQSFDKSELVGRVTEILESQKENGVANPLVTALSGDSFGVLVTYELHIPFAVFGISFADIEVPVEIVSKFTQKY